MLIHVVSLRMGVSCEVQSYIYLTLCEMGLLIPRVIAATVPHGIVRHGGQCAGLPSAVPGNLRRRALT